MAKHTRLHKPLLPTRDMGPFGVMTVADELRTWLALPVWSIKTEWRGKSIKATVSQGDAVRRSHRATADPLRTFSFRIAPANDIASQVFTVLEREDALARCRFCKTAMNADMQAMGFSETTYLCHRCGWRRPA